MTSATHVLHYTCARKRVRAELRRATRIFDVYIRHGEAEHPLHVRSLGWTFGIRTERNMGYVKDRQLQLTDKDLAFVSRHNIRISKPTQTVTSKPQVLLGCDQLWGLLEAPLPRYRLPSGLQLIPSQLGYLLTGKQRALAGEVAQEGNANINVVSLIERLGG
ncbi:hypothetical protein COOONC_04265 [Cooperia oncophora]